MSIEDLFKNNSNEGLGVGEPTDHNPTDVNDQAVWRSWKTHRHKVDSLISASKGLRRSGKTNLLPDLMHLLFGKSDGD